MKVHKQKTKTRIMTAIMCLSIALTTIIAPLQVEAATDNHLINIVDIILTKTGVVANHGILTEIEAEFRANMRQLIIEYDAWLTENDIEDININTFNEFVYTVDTEATSILRINRIAGLVEENAVEKYVIEYRINKNIEIDPIELTTGSPATNGNNVNISDDLVVYIRELFNQYAENEADYFYVDTIGPNEVNPLWFDEHADYLKFKNLLSTIPSYAYLGFTDGHNTEYFSYGADNQVVISSMTFTVYLEDVLFLNDKDKLAHHEYKILDTYNREWQTETDLLVFNKSLYWMPEDFEAMSKDYTNVNHGTGRMYPAKTMSGSYESGIVHVGLVSNDGRNAKIYNNLNALKLDTLGQSKYYVTNNFGDYNSNNNSMKISGDYVLGDYTTSHDTIQEQINNSGTITYDTVNNIVNDSSQTIINNYASNVIPDSSGDSGGSGGGGLGSILDGLGSIISAVADIIGFLLGVIGDVIGLIGDLFDTVFNGIKGIGEIFAGFAGLLGSLFPFIPEELTRFLTLAIEASVGIAIWRMFKKG